MKKILIDIQKQPLLLLIQAKVEAGQTLELNSKTTFVTVNPNHLQC